MSFTSNVGEKNGVYLNVKREKTSAHINVTIRCSVCGREFVRSNNTLYHKNLDRCICDELEQGQIRQRNRLKRPHSNDPKYIRCKTNFNSFLKEKLRENPELKYDSFDKIWAAVGEKPEDTQLCKWYLTRKNRGQRNPNFTADNMEWHPITTTRAVKMAESVSTKGHRSCLRKASKAKGLATEEEFMTCVQQKERQMRSEAEYIELVGRKLKSFRVIDVTQSVYGNGSVYMLRMICERCGKEVLRPGSKVMRDCRPCRCRSNAGRNARNSSTSAQSVLMRKKYMRIHESRLTLDQLLLLQATLSEYTIYGGTQEYILSRLEAAFLGMDLNA